MHYTCWPIEVYGGYSCKCGDFRTGPMKGDWTTARQMYREHVLLVMEREASRWHQEPT